RNLFLPGDADEVPLAIWASDVTVRDNVFNSGAQNLCLGVGRRGREPTPTRVANLGNTCNTTGSATLKLLDLDDAGEVAVYENLLVGPDEGTASIAEDTGAAVRAANNRFV